MELRLSMYLLTREEENYEAKDGGPHQMPEVLGPGRHARPPAMPGNRHLERETQLIHWSVIHGPHLLRPSASRQ